MVIIRKLSSYVLLVLFYVDRCQGKYLFNISFDEHETSIL